MDPSADIQQIVLKSSVANLDFLPASRDLGAAESKLPSEIGGQQFLKRALATLRDDYDVILIDCQPTMGQLTVNALVASNEVIVPLQCEYFALHGFIELSGNIEKVKTFLNPDLKLIGILATMYDRKTLHNREVLSAILDKYPDDVFDTIIAKTIRFSETTVAGEPITSYASSSGGAASYRRLARELIARGGARRHVEQACKEQMNSLSKTVQHSVLFARYHLKLLHQLQHLRQHQRLRRRRAFVQFHDAALSA